MSNPLHDFLHKLVDLFPIGTGEKAQLHNELDAAAAAGQDVAAALGPTGAEPAAAADAAPAEAVAAEAERSGPAANAAHPATDPAGDAVVPPQPFGTESTPEG